MHQCFDASAEGGCKERKVQFWQYNIGAHYKNVHSDFDVTQTIVDAMALLVGQQEIRPQ